jgi:uncharacterized protein YbjT (DUF2867 family)
VGCFNRRPDALARVTATDVEVVADDLLEVESLTVAMAAVQTDYYSPTRP